MIEKNVLITELKNDILLEIGEYKDWDIAEYTIIVRKQELQGGLIILKKSGFEIVRVLQKRFFSYFTPQIFQLFNPNEVNKILLIIYSSGEYESSFIWDEKAHIDYLIRLNEAYQDSIAEEFGIQFDDLSEGKTFTKGIVIIDIVNNEVKMETFFYDNQALVYQTPMLVDESWIGTILQVQEGTKNPALGTNAIIWNRMTIDIPWSKTDRNGVFDVKRDIKFEWREENA